LSVRPGSEGRGGSGAFFGVQLSAS